MESGTESCNLDEAGGGMACRRSAVDIVVYGLSYISRSASTTLSKDPKRSLLRTTTRTRWLYSAAIALAIEEVHLPDLIPQEVILNYHISSIC